MPAPPHFPPPPVEESGRADGDGPYRAPTTPDPATPLDSPRPPAIGADDVEWEAPDPRLARMLAATAGMQARPERPWIGRLASALGLAATWLLRGHLGILAWLVIVVVLGVLLVIEVRRAWRASDVER